MPFVAFAGERAVLRIGNDYGGLLVERLAEVDALLDAQTVVEIRGAICNSACTLYLGLPDVCVTPQVRLGFHGPASMVAGIGLLPSEFERLSQEMARRYPPPVASWFLQEARYVTNGVAEITGAALIQAGVRACP